MSIETDLTLNDRDLALKLPSGKRIFELARQAIEMEKSARAGSCPSYELFIADLCEQADDAMWKMDSAEKRFFQTLLREHYVKPEDRGKDWESSYEIRCDLIRELEGDNSCDEREIEEFESLFHRHSLIWYGLP